MSESVGWVDCARDGDLPVQVQTAATDHSAEPFAQSFQPRPRMLELRIAPAMLPEHRTFLHSR